MTKATLILSALATLAACDASLTTTGSSDPTAEAAPPGGAEGVDPPGTTGDNATPWWGLPG